MYCRYSARRWSCWGELNSTNELNSTYCKARVVRPPLSTTKPSITLPSVNFKSESECNKMSVLISISLNEQTFPGVLK